MVPRHLFESDASQALFFSQSNIDQRIVNLKAQACLRRWSRQAIAGGRRVALSLIRGKHHDWLSSQINFRPIGPKP
jgi:hypothetical protein